MADDTETPSLVDVMDAVRERYHRELSDHEIPVAVQMIENELPLEMILEQFTERVYIPSDDELETVRYEAVGSGVVEIPDVVPNGEQGVEDAEAGGP